MTRATSEKPIARAPAQFFIGKETFRVEDRGIGTEHLVIEVELAIRNQDFGTGNTYLTASRIRWLSFKVVARHDAYHAKRWGHAQRLYVLASRIRAEAEGSMPRAS